MKQKTLLTVLAASLLLLGASCTKKEEVRPQQENKISFNVLSDGALRATERTTTAFNADGNNFAVWGFIKSNHNRYVGTSASVGTKIEYKGTTATYPWDYANAADLAYWPSEAMNFFAVSDFGHTALSNVNVTDEAQSFDFTVPTANADQIDLMYASKLNLTKPADYKVPFVFKHALSQIVFKGQSKESNVKVSVQKIEVVNVKGKGTFTFPTAETADASAQGAWTSNETPNATYSTETETTEVTSAEAVTLSKSDGAFFVIPQTATAWTTQPVPAATGYTGQVALPAAGGNCYLKITLKLQFNGVYLIGDASTFGTTYVPFGGVAWQPGKKYIYTLKFGAGYKEDGTPQLDPIRYNIAGIEGWGTPEEVDINL